jgi:type IV secretory pathway VirB6-like protein
MFIGYMLKWWYWPGWLNQWKLVLARTASIASAFSGPTLLKTLFSPWKRVVAGDNPNANIQQKFQALEDNLISRFVGFGVRILTLIATLVMLVVVGLVNVALAIIWPLSPLFIIYAIFKAFGG